MIKLVCFFRRNPSLSRSEFHEHWLERHGPLIAGTPELAQHIVRYEQNHRLDFDYERDDPARPGFDGATVQWMESMRSFGAFVREPKYAEVLAHDEAYMLDRSSIALLFTHEAEMPIEGPRERAGLKLSCLLTRKAGVDAEAFHEHWRGPHAELFAKRPAISRHVVAYHQSHRLARDYDRDAGGGFDGLAEQWYEDPAAFQAMLGEDEYVDVPRDEATFIDQSATQYILGGPPDLIF